MSYYGTYEKEHRDQEEYDRIKERRRLLEEASALKQKEGVAEVVSEEKNPSSIGSDNDEMIARMELDCTISIAQGRYPTKWIKNEAATILTRKLIIKQGEDDTLHNESKIIERCRLSAIDVCQKSLDDALARQPARTLDEPPRSLLEGLATLTLPRSGRVVRYRLSLRVHCECVDDNNTNDNDKK